MILVALLAFAALLMLVLAGVLVGLGVGLLITGRSGATGGPRAALLVGLSGAGLVLGLFVGIVHYSQIKRQEAEARRGWNLVPVVVAAVDIRPSEVLSFDMISQRSVPEQFVTPDMVKPDSASYVVNQVVAVPHNAGDVIMWSAFCTTLTPPTARTP